MPVSNNEYDRLFREYLSICNRALRAHKDEFPYKQIWNMTENLFHDQNIKLAVYDDRPQKCYALQLQDNQFEPAQECKAEEAKHAWRLNRSYLEQVIANPDDYIEHPAKLDWDWLRNRFGL